MLPILSSEEYVNRLLETPRPNEQQILAFYEHRIGAICTDPRLLLLPVDDHLTHRGDGVFEALKYIHGRMYQLDEHIVRMQNSAKGIYLTPPCSWDEIRTAILDVAQAAGQPSGSIRILLGRGPGGFGVSFEECPQPSLYIIATRFTPKPESWFSQGLSSFRTSIPARQGYLAHIKNANYLPNVLMMYEAKTRGVDVPLCFDTNGHLAESALANVCIVTRQGEIVSPELTNALPGTTLLRAFELAKDTFPLRFGTITEDDIYSAQEVLVFGTSVDCVPIVSYEGKPIGSGTQGPVAKQLRAMIQQDSIDNGVPIPGLI